MLSIKIILDFLKSDSKNCKTIIMKNNNNVAANKFSLVCKASLKSSNPVKLLYVKLLEYFSPIDSVVISVSSILTNGKNKIRIDSKDTIRRSRYFLINIFIFIPQSIQNHQ